MTVHNARQLPLHQKASREVQINQKLLKGEATVVSVEDNNTSGDRRKPPHYMRLTSVRERYARTLDTSRAFKYSEELLQRAEDDDYDACQTLLEKGADVNVADEETKATALHIAAKYGQEDILSLLIRKGGDCNAQDSAEQSPLHLAAGKDYVECCRKLLECPDLNVNMQNKIHDSPLHYAAKEGRIDVCRMILEHPNVDVNAKNKKGMSPLHLAAQENQHRVIQLLMDNGADWKLLDRNSYLPLHYAAQRGFPESCEILLSHSNNEDKEKQLKSVLKDGKTPLILAAKSGHHRCCIKLTNTNIDAKDKKGNTALHHAAVGGFENTVEELLKMGAQPLTKNNRRSSPILEASSKRKAGCLRILIENKADMSVVDENNKTVLHYAAEKNAVECLRILLSNPFLKDFLDKKDNDGCTPLHLSIKREAVECAHMLLEKGASPGEQCSGGMTPLHLAADKGYTGICERLLASNDVRVSQENDTNATPLHLAALRGSTNVCQMLTRKGARLTAVDKHGRTALHVASSEGCSYVVKFLAKRGVPPRARDDTGSTALHLAATSGSLECCQMLVASAKAACLEVDQNGNLPLDKAFEKKQDEVFRFLLSQVTYKKMEEEQMLRLHRYVHTALNENRLTAVEAIIDSSCWHAVFIGENGHHCKNFRTLVKCHPRLALKVQDKCVQRSHAKVMYDLRIYEDNYYIPTATSKVAKSPYERKSGRLSRHARQFSRDGLEWKNSHPLTLMVAYDRHQLLQHGLTQAWLLHKWRSYVYIIFLALLLLELSFVTSLSVFMGSTDNWNHVEERCVLSRDRVCDVSAAPSEGHSLDSYRDGDGLEEENAGEAATFHENATITKFGECTGRTPLKRGAWWVLLIITSMTALLECNYIYRFKKEYLSVDNLMRVLRTFFSVTVLVPAGSCDFRYHIMRVEQWQCGIIALLLAWLHLINTLNQLPMLSVFMPITQRFLKSFLKVLLYIVMLLFVFAFTFHLLLKDQEAFLTVPQAMVKTVVWMLGDLGYDDTFLSDDHKLVYPVMVNCIFVLFVTIIGGFLINLVITQPSQKLEEFKDNAAFYRAANRINLFLKLDVCFPFFQRSRTRETFDDEETKAKGYNILIKKLLMLDTKEEKTESPNPRQLLLEEQNMQIRSLLTLHSELMEEIWDLKHQLNVITKSLQSIKKPKPEFPKLL